MDKQVKLKTLILENVNSRRNLLRREIEVSSVNYPETLEKSQSKKKVLALF